MMRQSVFRRIFTVRAMVSIVLALVFYSPVVSAKKATRSPGIVCHDIGLIPSRAHVFSGKDTVHTDEDGVIWVPGRRFDGLDVYPLESVMGGKDIRIYNVSESNGYYYLAFDVVVPQELLNDRLQVQIHPELIMGADVTPMPSVFLSGTRFRKAQVKRMQSLGLDTDDLALSEDVMLDSTCVFGKEDHVYRYVRKVPSEGHMQEMKIRVSVLLDDGNKNVVSFPYCDSVVFLPSAIRSFASQAGHAMPKEYTVVSNLSTSYKIEFPSGKSEIQPSYHKNAVELERLHDDMLLYLNSDRMMLDSVVVKANVSPDGNWSSNYALSMKRGENVSNELSSFLFSYASGYSGVRNKDAVVADMLNVGFSGTGNPENWDLLKRLVETDERLSISQKSKFSSQMTYSDVDERERRMQKDNYYEYMKEYLYPQLRMIDVRFVLSRRPARQHDFAPVKMNSDYSDAVIRLRNGHYREALSILEPYQDFNTAVAYACVGDFVGALDILLGYSKEPVVSYLIAYCLSKGGAIQSEVDRYLLLASEGNRAFRYRAYIDGLTR